MSPHPDPSRGTYLPTGWRVVGEAAERLAELLATSANGTLKPGDLKNTLYAVQCTFAPATSGRPTVETILDAITDQIRDVDPECPRLIRDEDITRPVSRLRGLQFTHLVTNDPAWTGEIVWRAVHPMVPGAPVTTHVILEETGSLARLSLRVTADEGIGSVRSFVGAGQAQPAFLHHLRAHLDPTWMGAPLQAHLIPRHGVEGFVHSLLAAPDRDIPIAVLTPLEEGGYLVDPEDLAWDLLGRARLYVMADHQQTFDLTDTVGDRRMSCYWGATRCYMPGWTRHDNPYDHPLLLGEQVADPLLLASWIGEVGLWLGKRLQLPPSIEDRRAPVPAPSPQPAQEPAPTQADTAPALDADAGTATTAPAAELRDSSVELRPVLAELLQEVRGLAGAVGQMAEEVERLRTITSVRSSSTNAVDRRLSRLEDILQQISTRFAPVGAADDLADAAGEPVSAEDGQPTLPEIVQSMAESQADALVFLPAAAASAANSPYEDPERVRAILEAMASVARRRRDGALGTSLREAFAELGIDYRPAIARTTSARLRSQYRFTGPNGELVEAEEHIGLGNTYDPRRCLRIYFSSRVGNEPRFVIAHVGRHFEVESST